MEDLKKFWKKGEYPESDEKAKKVFKIICFAQKERLFEKPMSYQRFIEYMHRIRKAIYY